ncbi:MAG: type II secretion system protein [Chloroflexi bacterium]|nr:type II secretion system protein [Chloroflexota bacterium]
MYRHRCQLKLAKSQQGLTLLEVTVAVALLGLVIPLVFGVLSAVTKGTDRVYDRSVLFEIVQSQLEHIESQTYQENASNYTRLTPPEGYTITVSAAPAVTYVYAAPKSTATEETVQLITVNVTGVWGDMTVSRYRVRP